MRMVLVCEAQLVNYLGVVFVGFSHEVAETFWAFPLHTKPLISHELLEGVRLINSFCSFGQGSRDIIG